MKGKYSSEAVARVSKTFGQNGELTLNLFDSFPPRFNTEEPLFVIIDSLAVPLFCDFFERRGTTSARVAFGDINTTRRAEELLGHELYLSNAAIAQTGTSNENETETYDDDEIFLEDLVGYQVYIQGVSSPSASSSLDHIEAFIDGENPLFQLSFQGKEVLIPAVDEFITEIDTEQRTIEFTLPEGLLDLYLQ